MKLPRTLALAAALALGCATTQESTAPVATGAAPARADAEARALAERVAESMGGWEAWHGARTITWRFFGGRRHVWDKATGALRLEDGANVTLLDLGTRQGRAFENGEEVTEPAARQAALERAYGRWVNDSYWMFLPWKLLDPGVVLLHAGPGELEDGRPCQVLDLTFGEVGLTPRNRYLVRVGDASGLVEEWSFFRDRDDAEPAFTLPWRGWERAGPILVCTDHGALPGRDPGDWEISVLGELPRAVFEDPAPVQLPSAQAGPKR